jgi:glycosyltransferase involved in cell wall biosynthesis
VSPSPVPPPVTPNGNAPPHAVHVLGGGCASTSVHVRSLAAGLVAHGLRVTVCAPPGAQLRYQFTAAGAYFAPLPARTQPEAARALRRVCADADVVHAHGLRAGLLAATVLALGGRRRSSSGRRAPGGRASRPPLVVTWHHRGPAEGAGARLARFMERRAVRAAAVVLATTSDLVYRARRLGARDARFAPVALPPLRHGPGGESGEPGAAAKARTPLRAEERAEHKARAEVGAVGRPLVFSVGRLDARHGYDAVLTAARAWRHLDPQPLLAIAGEGPWRARLQRRIEEEELPVRLLGRRDDAFELLAGADVALLSTGWESRSQLAQEALAEGVPLVATSVGGLPELVGAVGVLVPYGDPDALATAVTKLLGDPERRQSLAEAGRARAATWPTESDTVTQVLGVYDELTAGAAGR